MYGVIVQPITNDTTPANVETYGEVVDMDHAFDKGFSRDLCDGQTSPVPPRWADDQAGMIYTYDKRTADMFSGILRDDVASRVASGAINQAPSWIKAGQVTTAALTVEARLLLVDEISAGVAESVTNSQIQTAINSAINSGARTANEVTEWIIENVGWME